MHYVRIYVLVHIAIACTHYVITHIHYAITSLYCTIHSISSLDSPKGCPLDVLRYVGGKSCEGRGSVHPKVTKIFQDRLKRFQSGQNLDWATAEAMAVGSILMNGVCVCVCVGVRVCVWV